MKKLSKTIANITLMIFLTLFLAIPLMWVWNYVVPDIFGLPKIGYVQALYLNFLFKIISNKLPNIEDLEN